MSVGCSATHFFLHKGLESGYQSVWELRDRALIQRMGVEGNLTMNSPWKNLQSVNQPTCRLRRASAGNGESLMLSVPLQPCNEISGQSDGIILMVFSRFVPRALTPLTDKSLAMKENELKWWIYKYSLRMVYWHRIVGGGGVGILIERPEQQGFRYKD